MKKLLAILVLATITSSAHAVISVERSTSPEQVMNQGYSSQMADTIAVSKARANGEKYYTPDEVAFKKQNKFVRFWRKLYVYADPAAEDYSYYHHDVDSTPSYTDL